MERHRQASDGRPLRPPTGRVRSVMSDHEPTPPRAGPPRRAPAAGPGAVGTYRSRGGSGTFGSRAPACTTAPGSARLAAPAPPGGRVPSTSSRGTRLPDLVALDCQREQDHGAGRSRARCCWASRNNAPDRFRFVTSRAPATRPLRSSRMQSTWASIGKSDPRRPAGVALHEVVRAGDGRRRPDHLDGVAAEQAGERRVHRPRQSVTSALLHVRPPPNATSSTVSPGLHRPVRRASSSAIGTLAAEVFP